MNRFVLERAQGDLAGDVLPVAGSGMGCVMAVVDAEIDGDIVGVLRNVLVIPGHVRRSEGITESPRLRRIGERPPAFKKGNKLHIIAIGDQIRINASVPPITALRDQGVLFQPVCEAVSADDPFLPAEGVVVF